MQLYISEDIGSSSQMKHGEMRELAWIGFAYFQTPVLWNKRLKPIGLLWFVLVQAGLLEIMLTHRPKLGSPFD